MKRTVVTALAMLALVWSTVPAGADEGQASLKCVADASLYFVDGKGTYTTSPPPAHVLFRIRLQQATCPEVTYTLFVLDGKNGDELADAEKVGGGMIISYDIPIDEDPLPPQVCVYSEVTIDGELVPLPPPPPGRSERRTASTCLVLPLNATSAPGEDYG